MDAYYSPVASRVFVTEFEEKRSRFLSFLSRVTCEEEARAFISTIRARFPDARHHCSAFIYRVEGSHPVMRSSDDGEPSGTAGAPMLEVLKRSSLIDVAVVVVRYFGGTLLGTGGLVRAYSRAVSDVLALTETVQRVPVQCLCLSAPLDVVARWEADLRVRGERRGVRLLDVKYGTVPEIILGVAPGEQHVSAALGLIASVTKGRGVVRVADTPMWIER